MMGECSREAHLCLARSRGQRRGLLCRRAGCGKAGVGVGGFPMQSTAAHDTAFSERHDRARSATTLDSSPAARPSQHVTTSHVVPAHQVRLDCVFPEQHRHRVVDMSRRNVSMLVHALQTLNQSLFECVGHHVFQIDTVASLCKLGGRQPSAVDRGRAALGSTTRSPSSSTLAPLRAGAAVCVGRSQARSRANRLRSASEQWSRAPS